MVSLIPVVVVVVVVVVIGEKNVQVMNETERKLSKAVHRKYCIAASYAFREFRRKN